MHSIRFSKPGGGGQIVAAPVDRDITRNIDAVIAWVDGSDPKHQARLQQFLEPGEKARATRYADRGEIYCCIASILKYAPFIHRIWIVADGQCPRFVNDFARAGLCKPDFIRVVDHTELFRGYPEALPNFNSRSIEAMLWRIPGLTEQFVYFNDDFFLNRPLSPEDWFVDGKPVLRGRRVRPDRLLFRTRVRRLLSKLRLGTSGRLQAATYHRAQELGAVYAGVPEHFLFVDHHPHPMRRSVQDAFYTAHPEILRAHISYRFRHIHQYWPVSLANHLEIAVHGATFRPPAKMMHARPGGRNVRARLIADISSERKLFGCIQSLDKFDSETRRLVRDLMRRKWGDFLPPSIKLEGEA